MRRARRRELDAGLLGQFHDLLCAAIEHVERDEVAAARIGPARDAGPCERRLERLAHLREFRRDDRAMPLHEPIDALGILQ
jgi:hypothetical protein